MASYDSGHGDYGYGGFPWCKKYVSNPEWGTDGKPYGWEDGRRCIAKDGCHSKGDMSHSKGCSSDHSTEYSKGDRKLQ
ncbi:hypothetical protein HK105_202606 [Polyrhizophydium stewartii]|uniref:Uncharacterized protein n=1 Tax=Polyrhizophydium stewartii TaxID=2732419 RepID=A0ABR4NDZ0_9FUNG